MTDDDNQIIIEFEPVTAPLHDIKSFVVVPALHVSDSIAVGYVETSPRKIEIIIETTASTTTNEKYKLENLDTSEFRRPYTANI